MPPGLMVALVLLLLLSWGCTYSVKGQRIAAHRFVADENDFEVEPHEDVVVMHYYGVGGWGILWKDSYLLTAPYFSNHGILGSSIAREKPDVRAIEAGFAHTPFAKTNVILVGHGHVDHASDVPAYPFDRMPPKPTLIADESTIRLLGTATRSRICAIPLDAASGTATIPTSGKCATGSFRIRPLPWAHAPHGRLEAIGVYLNAGNPQGTQSDDLDHPPAHGNDWLIGRTWGFLIELLDDGKPVFRIHYVDAATNPDFVGPQPSPEGPTNVHIGCVPGFDYVTGYPTEVIEHYRVKYVFAGHWEDFFSGPECRLKPVHVVLNEEKMSRFATEVEEAIPKPHAGSQPINKTGCEVGRNCGPHGKSWTVPIPGETFRFAIAK